MSRKPVIPTPPPGEHWSLDYLQVLAEAETAMGELAEAAEGNKLVDTGSNDIEALVTELLEVAGGASYAATRLRQWQARFERRCPGCGSPESTCAWSRERGALACCPDCAHATRQH